MEEPTFGVCKTEQVFEMMFACLSVLFMTDTTEPCLIKFRKDNVDAYWTAPKREALAPKQRPVLVEIDEPNAR
jgi:hypothetical protein